jgi:hypothetical protein
MRLSESGEPMRFDITLTNEQCRVVDILLHQG